MTRLFLLSTTWLPYPMISVSYLFVVKIILTKSCPDWKTFTALETTIKIVCQASNRTVIGLPLCQSSPIVISMNWRLWFRFRSWSRLLELNTQFTADVVHHLPIGTSIPEAVSLKAVFHTLFSSWDSTFCNRIVNRLFSKLPQRLQRGMKHLKPIIDSLREEQERICNAYEQPVSILTSLTTIPLLNVGRLLSAWDFLSWITERPSVRSKL